MKSSISQYPLRPRSTLELFDVSLKLYKKYFWALSGVSALVWASVAFVQFVFASRDADFSIAILFSGILAIFLWPFLFGAGGCCLRAAVEAREVGFCDCMRFAAKRYERILQMVSLAALYAILLTIVYVLILLWITRILTFIVEIFPAFDHWAPYPFFLLSIIVALTSLFFVGFLSLFPLLACLEERWKAVRLRKRCFALAWSGAKKLMGLVFLNGLGFLALLVILEGLTSFAIDLVLVRDSMQGVSSDTSVLIAFWAAATSFSFVNMIWSPLYLMTLGTFYIDMRIRKEAFDLEYQLSQSDRI